MASTFPGAPDDLSAAGLTHGDVTDALAAVEAYLGNGGRLLAGTTTPVAGTGLDDLDGVSNPWRWSPDLAGWVGPAYEVTWSTGDQFAAVGNGIEYDLTVTALPASLNAFPLYASTVTADAVETATPVVADSDGEGVAYVVQYEPGNTHTTVPDPAMDPATLFGDFTIGTPYEFTAVDVGADGDFYLDNAAALLYGPKATTWPPPVYIRGFDIAASYTLTGVTTFGPLDPAIPDAPPLVIAAGVEVNAAGYLGPSQAALWYEDTEGAPVLHVKATDATGAVFVGAIPLTAV